MQPFLDGTLSDGRGRRRRGSSRAVQWCAKRYRFEERLRHYVRVASEPMSPELKAKLVGAPHAALAELSASRHRPGGSQVGAVDEHRRRAPRRLRRGSSAQAERASTTGWLRACRRSSPPTTGASPRCASTRSTARGSSVGPVGEHDQRVRRPRRRARRGRSGATRPGRSSQSGQCTSAAPARTRERVRAFDHDDLVDARLARARRAPRAAARPASARRSASRRPRRARRACAGHADVDGRRLDLDHLASAARVDADRRACRSHRRPRALGHLAEHGVVRRELGVRAVTTKNWLPAVPAGSACVFAIATTPVRVARRGGRPVDGRVARPARPGARRVAALDHEAGNDAVEDRLVEEALAREADEGCGRRPASLHGEPDREAAAVRVQRHVVGLRRVERGRRASARCALAGRCGDAGAARARRCPSARAAWRVPPQAASEATATEQRTRQSHRVDCARRRARATSASAISSLYAFPAAASPCRGRRRRAATASERRRRVRSASSRRVRAAATPTSGNAQRLRSIAFR